MSPARGAGRGPLAAQSHRSRQRGRVVPAEGALPIGCFIEDHFGQTLLANLRTDYERWFAVYGCYCACITEHSELPLIYHLDGRKYYTDSQRAQKSWAQNPSPDRSTANWADWSEKLQREHPQ